MASIVFSMASLSIRGEKGDEYGEEVGELRWFVVVVEVAERE
jgi:hypothetical protein